MADIVSFVTNPAGALGGALAGGGATLAGRALGNIPGGNELASFALGEVSNLLQGDRNAAGIYNAFLTQVLQNFANSPNIAPLWVCYIGQLQRNSAINPQYNVVGVYADLVDKNTSSHDFGMQGTIATQFRGTQAVSQTLGSGFGIMFCQGVTLPADSVLANRDTYNFTAGGFLPGIVGGNRVLNEVTISYLETNASFTDFFLRPWMISNSYLGVPDSFKADIFIDCFVKTTPGSPLMSRKTFVLKNARPVSIDSEKMEYRDTVDTRQVQFIYDDYVLLGSSTPIAWLTTKQETNESTFLSRLGSVALNVATGLLNKQLESLETNLFSIRPQIVSPTAPGSIQTINQIPSQPKTPGTRDVAQILQIPTQPVLTKLKEDTAEPFEIIANRLQKVIPPANDAIGVEELQNIAATGQIPNPTNDSSTASLTRPLFVTKNPPEQDSPSYRPFARPVPPRIPSAQDIPASPVTNSVPFQLKSNRRNDTAADTVIKTQQVSVRRNDSIES